MEKTYHYFSKPMKSQGIGKDIDEAIDNAKKNRKNDLAIAERVFKEWQETKFGTSVTELEFITYLQTEWVKQI